MALPVSTITSTATVSAAELRRGRRGDGAAATGFLAPSLLGLLAFTAFPIVASVALSFYNWPVFGRHTFTGLKNYETLLASEAFHTAVLNTLLFVVLYVPLNIVVSLGLAVWISPRIKGRGAYRTIFFIPAVTPVVANAAIFSLILSPNGLVDSLSQTWFGKQAPNFLGSTTWAMAAVVLLSIWQGFGYNMLVFSAALDAVPATLTEQAAIDGAGTFARFFKIVLPLLTPSIFFAVVLTLISSFQVFTQAYVLTGGGPGNTTTTMVLYLYEQGFRFFKLGLASAVAWVLFLIILAITVFQFVGQKKWVNYDQ
ncbi:carbohydrate ABC transporter membrane protein 1, CUT1 family [Friedmanniella luteola]|uniref:Carbohydrate ABC transporter membrane protein 1, CUT1 family n=1 Tax=Friedmanniella luteola TaxID=546871 RepID=A0A1H1XKT6_9ACTN|nr:sugar ABC transporter permease [Friedmanniella luteola]SDT09782.1 carbohydrate ABC transporter membrane protein 1, CUT1 family [Friedmanniella luteola]